MNDVRTFIVGFVAVISGFTVAWFIFGGKASQLEVENRALRELQASHYSPAVPQDAGLRAKLVGEWATTVSQSRLGRIELIFELRDDGEVRWRSVQDQQFTTIAEGTWRVEDDKVLFLVTVVDQRSPDKGQSKSATARVLELSGACLSLDVEGDEWAFHRTST